MKNFLLVSFLIIAFAYGVVPPAGLAQVQVAEVEQLTANTIDQSSIPVAQNYPETVKSHTIKAHPKLRKFWTKTKTEVIKIWNGTRKVATAILPVAQVSAALVTIITLLL